MTVFSGTGWVRRLGVGGFALATLAAAIIAPVPAKARTYDMDRFSYAPSVSLADYGFSTHYGYPARSSMFVGFTGQQLRVW
jgi:hypothetical protein